MSTLASTVYPERSQGASLQQWTRRDHKAQVSSNGPREITRRESQAVDGPRESRDRSNFVPSLSRPFCFSSRLNRPSDSSSFHQLDDIQKDFIPRLRQKVEGSKHVRRLQFNLREAPPLTQLQPQKKETELKDKKIIKEREKICPEDLVPEALHLCVPLPPFPHGGRGG